MTCTSCERRYIVDLLVPNEVWERIAQGDYALCPECMDARMAEFGVTCDRTVAFVRGSSLRSERTPALLRVAAAWRPSASMVENSGSIGNPAMDELFEAVRL